MITQLVSIFSKYILQFFNTAGIFSFSLTILFRLKIIYLLYVVGSSVDVFGMFANDANVKFPMEYKHFRK